MKEIDIKAYGKLNISLCITGKSGGLHTLESLACHVNLCDCVNVKRGVYSSVEYSTGGIARGGVEKALDILKAKGFGGLKINVRKFLPIAGGMGGSSADVAATLAAARDILGIDDGIVAEIAKECGSDVPFMLYCPTGVIRGTGDKVERTSDFSLNFVAARNGKSVTSAECYATFDALGKACENSDVSELIDALRIRDLASADEKARNSLYDAAIAVSPDIAVTCAEFERIGRRGHMTGSGNTIFCFTADDGDSDKVCAETDEKFSPFKLKTIDKAWEIY